MWSHFIAQYCTVCLSWAPVGIFLEGGKTARTDKNDLFFDAPKARTKIFAIFRRFGLNLRVFDASVFSTGTAYDVIIFKFQGGQLPQVAPPPPGAYDVFGSFFFNP